MGMSNIIIQSQTLKNQQYISDPCIRKESTDIKPHTLNSMKASLFFPPLVLTGLGIKNCKLNNPPSSILKLVLVEDDSALAVREIWAV